MPFGVSLTRLGMVDTAFGVADDARFVDDSSELTAGGRASGAGPPAAPLLRSVCCDLIVSMGAIDMAP